jgi:hypothetical protein
LQLELSATPPGAPVTQLWLEAESARPRIGQAGLFQPLAPEAQKLELTLARMHKLLAVREQLRAGSAEIVDTHQPDAFKVERFRPIDPEDKASGKPKIGRSDERQKDRGSDGGNERSGAVRTENLFGALSLRRFRPPFSAWVDLCEGVPVRMNCAELGARDPLHDNIVWAAGPWRTSGNWWEGKRNSEATKREVKTTTPSTSMRVSGRDKNEEKVSGEMRAGLDGQSVAESWKNEEWDIALAIPLQGASARERTTQINLYRLIQSRTTEQWLVEGGYD